MNISIEVNASTCIRCTKCVTVCPSKIFVQNPDKSIGVENRQMCIGCGHCAAVCPTSSVEHSTFPPSTVHKIDRENLPTPGQLMMLCHARRSNRSMTHKPVPAEALRMILEAAHCAPTASNMQNVEFTVVSDPEELTRIGRYTVEVFDKMMRPLKNPLLASVLRKIMPGNFRYLPVFDRIKKALDSGDNMITRNATTLIFIHSPRGDRFGTADCNLAYQNGSLMAESLGVSQVYMGFVLTAIRTDKKRKLLNELGITGDVHAIMGVGIPAFQYPNYVDRKAIVVTE